MPSCFHSDPHLDSSLLQFAIKPFGFAVLVQQPSFAILSSLVIDKRDLLETRVIIQSYNQHVRLLPPEFPMGLRPTHRNESAFPRPIDSKWVNARLSTEPWLVLASTKFTQVDGADAVMKSSGSERLVSEWPTTLNLSGST